MLDTASYSPQNPEGLPKIVVIPKPRADATIMPMCDGEYYDPNADYRRSPEGILQFIDDLEIDGPRGNFVAGSALLEFIHKQSRSNVTKYEGLNTATALDDIAAKAINFYETAFSLNTTANNDRIHTNEELDCMILTAAAPLFNLENTITPKICDSIRQKYIEILDAINYMIRLQPHSTKEQTHLIGKANELAVLIALTDPLMADDLSLVARPSLPYEDSPQSKESDQVGVDIVLDNPEPDKVIKIQVKTSEDEELQKRYLEAGIPVVSVEMIVSALSQRYGIEIGKKDFAKTIDLETVQDHVREIIIAKLGLKMI